MVVAVVGMFEILHGPSHRWNSDSEQPLSPLADRPAPTMEGKSPVRAALRKNDRRRFLIRWDKQDKATGYILRWGVHPDRLNRAVMVYDNQLEAGYFNADSPYYFSIDAFNEKGVTRGNTVIEGAVFFGEPYSGDPPEIPCTLEAEDFNEGGQGFAYYDTSPRNTFGLYRDTDVDIDYSRGIDAYFLANTADGEYLNYTLRVPETGFYHFDCIGAAVNTSGGFYLSFNGEKVDKPSLTSLPTGTVGNFRTTRLPDVLFNQGIQVMTFHPYDNIYVDKFIISRSGTGIRLPDKPVLSVHPNPSSGIFNIRIPQNVFLSVYTLAGRRISPEILIQSTYNLDITNKPAGIYFLVLRTDDQVCRLKLIKK